MKNKIKNISLIFLILFILLSPGTYVHADNGQEELFLVAQKAFEDGFYDVAMRYINQLLEQYPQSEKRIQANLLLGQCYFFKNQYLKAYDIFQSLLPYPEFKDATLFWLGETYLKGADYQQAIKNYQQLIELFPDSLYTPQGYYSLGWAYFDQNDYEKAKGTFSTLIKKFPTHQLSEDGAFKLGETYYNLHDYEGTIKHFKQFVIDHPKSTRHAESYFYIGESYYYQDDPLNAISYYAKAVDISYDNRLILMAKVSLGWCYLKLNKLDLAQLNFEEADKFSKDKKIPSEDVLLGEASLYTETKNTDAALNAYDQLFTNFPQSKRLPDAYLGKANIHYMAGNYNQAISTYQELINKFSNLFDQQNLLEKAYFGLAWSYLKAGDIDASIKNFQTIKDKSENKIIKISAFTQIGDAYQDVGQLDKALEVYDQILKSYPDSPYTDYVQYRQGITLLKMEKFEAAMLSFQSLQTNFPKSHYVLDAEYYLTVAYFKRGDWKQAREQAMSFIRKAMASNEFLPEANYILALSYFNQEDYKQALSAFESIIKNYPEQSMMIRNSQFHIAKCYYFLNNPTEALKRFDVLINQYPHSQVAQESIIWVGDYHLKAHDYENAMIYYKKYLDEYPTSDQANTVRYQLAMVYEAMGNYADALNILKQINNPNEKEVFARAQLAIAEIFSRELPPESSLETYRKIIALCPEFKRDVFLKMAEVHRKLKNYSQALDIYQKAIAADQGLSQAKDAEIQFSIGDTYELLNNTDQAVEAYFKIPYLYPDEIPLVVKSYLRIARIFEDEQKWEEAKSIYNKIVDLNTAEVKYAKERLDWIAANTNTHN